MKRILTTFSQKWPEFFLEILVIVVGVFGAYTLNDWGTRRARNEAEREILTEIKGNLQLDLIDLKGNQTAHSDGLKFLDSLENANEANMSDEKMGIYLWAAFRDFVYLPQTGAFETLKAKGVDIVSNDSLRLTILRLYDFQYNGIVIIEGEYQPSSFTDDYHYIQNNYFKRFNLDLLDWRKSEIKPVYEGYDWLQNPDVIIRFDRTRSQRSFMLQMYNQVIDNVNSTIDFINQELTE